MLRPRISLFGIPARVWMANASGHRPIFTLWNQEGETRMGEEFGRVILMGEFVSHAILRLHVLRAGIGNESRSLG